MTADVRPLTLVTTAPKKLQRMVAGDTVAADTLPAATTSVQGALSAADKVKIDAIASDISTAVAAEAVLRAADVDSEETARIAADAAIQAELDAHEGSGGAAHAAATEAAAGFLSAADKTQLVDLARVRELLAQSRDVAPDDDTSVETLAVFGQGRWRAGTDTTGFTGLYFYAEMPSSFGGTIPNAFASTSDIALYSPIGVPNTGAPASNAPANTEATVNASMYWDDGIPIPPNAFTGGAMLEIDLFGQIKIGRAGVLYLVLDPDGDVRLSYAGNNSTLATETHKVLGAVSGSTIGTVASIVRDTDDNIKINLTAHGLVDDQLVWIGTADRTLGIMPNMIEAGYYYVDKIDDDNFKPSTTPVAGANYLWWYPTPTQSTAVRVAGVAGYEVDRDASGDVIITKAGHGLTPGALYQITSTGTIIPSLVSGNSYYADVLDVDTFKPSTTAGPGFTYVNWAPTPAESDEVYITTSTSSGSWKQIKLAFNLATNTQGTPADFVPVRIRIVGCAEGRGALDTEDGVIWYVTMDTFEVSDRVGTTTTTAVVTEGASASKTWKAAAQRTSPGKGQSGSSIWPTAAPLLFASTSYDGSGTDSFLTTAYDYGGQWDEIMTAADITASVPLRSFTSSQNHIDATTTLLSVGGTVCGEVIEVLNGRRILRYRPFSEAVRIKSGDTVDYAVYKYVASTWSAVAGATGSFTAGGVRLGPQTTQLAIRAAMDGDQDGTNVLDIRGGVARLTRNRKR